MFFQTSHFGAVEEHEINICSRTHFPSQVWVWEKLENAPVQCSAKRALCSEYSPGHQTTCALAILFLFAGIHLRCVDSDSLVHLVDFRMNSVLLPCTDLEFHLVRYDELYCHPFLQCLLDYKEVRIFDFLAPTDLLQLRGTSFATLQEFNDWAREQHSATQSAPQDGCR